MDTPAPDIDWARLRFAIVGSLLVAPPAAGALGPALDRLAAQTWRHPTTGEPLRFARSTIERWLYTARNAGQDPVQALRHRVRKDAGSQPRVVLPLREAIRTQWQAHPGWTVQLHYDNLQAVVATEPTLGPVPSYATVRRFFKAQGLARLRRKGTPPTAGSLRAEQRLATVEVRSFEVEHVNGLWHADYHTGSRKVLTPDGRWIPAYLLGVLDDRSRLAAHVQWYLAETGETFAHGFAQAIQKRGLPRALMTDQGGPMLAAEIQRGLRDLGILHEPTLPYSPHQNAKQEVFWASVEGRLLAMLEGVTDLTLALLNEATQAWAELDYNQKVHAELGESPLARYLRGPDVGRASPDSAALRRAFRLEAARTQRQSDGTVSLEGRRFEVPSRFRHLDRLWVRYARWDLSRVDLVDPRTGTILSPLHPLDKAANAEGRRRPLDPVTAPAPVAPRGMAPLLRQLLQEYATTGLPPAYIPTPSEPGEETETP
jgi:transposase InsO family protein